MLFLHISTATITLLICAYGWVRPGEQIRNILNIFSLFSVSTGIFLTLGAGGFTRPFCLKLGIYLLFIAMTHLRISPQSAKI